MHIAIFMDILSLMYQLSLSLQRDKHDPVKVTTHLNEFTWTMSKLCLIIENSLDEDDDGQVRHVSKPSVRKLKTMTGNSFIKALSLQNMS